MVTSHEIGIATLLVDSIVATFKANEESPSFGCVALASLRITVAYSVFIGVLG
jgi:hypothetical protein